MAQVVERILGKDEVTSSNLVSSSRKNLAKARFFQLIVCRLYLGYYAVYPSPHCGEGYYYAYNIFFGLDYEKIFTRSKHAACYSFLQQKEAARWFFALRVNKAFSVIVGSWRMVSGNQADLRGISGRKAANIPIHLLLKNILFSWFFLHIMVK